MRTKEEPLTVPDFLNRVSELNSDIFVQVSLIEPRSTILKLSQTGQVHGSHELGEMVVILEHHYLRGNLLLLFGDPFHC